MKTSSIFFCLLLLAKFSYAQQSQGDPALTEIWNPVPKVVTPGQTNNLPPSDAIVLFQSGKDSANWTTLTGKPFNWKISDGFMTVAPASTSSDIRTKKSFGDCQLHIEWRTPDVVKGEGQGRGNSGIFFMGKYELQVLDSYNNKTYSNGQAGSIYKQHIPMVNASRPPGEWQTYEVIFTAPRFYNDSMLKSPARISVFHNGVLVQNNVELWGPTQYIGVPKYIKHGDKEPLVLQDHHDLVSYRNIWIREL